MTSSREHFRIRGIQRKYDREAGKFSFYVAYETTTQLTPRTVAVAEAFGLGVDQEQKFEVLDAELKIGPTDIVYVTGDSGSGKSVLLRAIKKDLSDEAADMADVHVDPDKPLIETIGATVEEGLELLSKVGLNDAFLFLRTYDQLSDGQKYRYRLAKMVEGEKQWWIMDEFCSLLDRDTAKIVAFNVQKLARQAGKAVIAATTHADLLEDFNPSVHVHKRFGKEISVSYYPNGSAVECSLAKEMRIEPGVFDDWRKLSGFHYRSHNAGASREIYCLKRGYELCGVIVYCYPPVNCAGRRLMLPRMDVKTLNKRLSIISRVVVHPKYRTVGLGAKLVRETLPRIGTPCVEMVAVMAKYNPFAEKAGMRKVIEKGPSEEAVKISKALKDVGFNLQLLGSEKHVYSVLYALSPEQLARVKEVLAKNDHPRLSKEIVPGRSRRAYGSKAEYIKAVADADLEKLAKLIRIVGMLLQTKAYLYWQRPEAENRKP